jgi:predicted MFS family arabinose efflux permease
MTAPIDATPQVELPHRAAGPGLPATFSRRRAWGAVLLLMVIAVCNVIDRLLPGTLAELIKHDLHLSDTVIGLINGFGFVVIYAVLGVPIARLSDRGTYGLVISACLALWSVMTFMGAMAQTAWQLALTRMGVALGEAGSSPAAHAFIARNFPADQRGSALAVLNLHIPFASLLALMGGGLLGQAFGWRAAFMIMGVAGLILAPTAVLVLGPRQPGAATAETPSMSLRPALALFRKPSFTIILVATAFVGIGGYALVAFSAAFLMRVHGMAMGEVGVNYGIAVGIGGVISVLLTGVSADRLSSRDPRWVLWVQGLMIALLLPFSYTAFLTQSRWTALVCMALANIVATAFLAPAVAAVQRLATNELRATASALLLLFTALAGGLGPFLTGLISDALQADMGARALGRAMLVVPVSHTIAGLLYLAATLTFRRDMAVEAP